MKSRGNRKGIFITLLFFFLLFGLLTSASGQSISLVSTSGLTATVQVTCPGGSCSGISIDWGDGTQTPLPASSPVTQSHTYSLHLVYCIQLFCAGEPCNFCSTDPEIGICSGPTCLPVNLLSSVDTTPPTITITNPTTSTTYPTSSPSITLGGTASDNVGVTQVTWVNNRGGSGTAAETTAWTASGIALQSGDNIITVTAHDAAGNTGTDIITVTYTPLGGAFSVTPSPSSSGVVPGQSNSIPIIYTVSATGGGSFTVTSSQGQFVTQSGTVLYTINNTVLIRIVNGTGTAPEGVIMPASVITAALNANQNRIFYRRTFSSASNSASSEVALQIVPASAGPFSLVKMAIAFVQKTGPTMAGGMVRQGRATVPRNSSSLKAAAHITYNGSGLLMGQWKVDGQVLGYVSQYLYAGIREVVIESPDVPGLPTYDTGRHSVELEIIQPTPPFEEPIIYYYVTQEPGGGTPQTLQLLSPDDHATVPLAASGGAGPEFHWDTLGGTYLYHLELYPAHAAATHGATLPFGGGTTSGSPGPIISADTQVGSYNLSQANMDNLQPGVEYTWRVQAFQENELVAASVYWMVSFETVQAEGGEPYFEFLHITPAFQENQGPLNFAPAEPESHWFHFGPRNAYAIEMGTGESICPIQWRSSSRGNRGSRPRS